MVWSRMDWASMMHRHVCVCERESQTGAFSAFCCVVRTFVDDMQVAFVDQCRHNIAIVDSISVSVMHLQLSISMSATSINKYNVDKWFWTQNWVHNLSINVGTTLHLSIRSVCHWCNLHLSIWMSANHRSRNMLCDTIDTDENSSLSRQSHPEL